MRCGWSMRFGGYALVVALVLLLLSVYMAPLEQSIHCPQSNAHSQNGSVVSMARWDGQRIKSHARSLVWAKRRATKKLRGSTRFSLQLSLEVDAATVL